MSLDSGLYRILNADRPVGRARVETLDLAPKAVFARTDDEDTVWVVEALPGGLHKLYAKGAPVAADGGRPAGPLVALLVRQEHAGEWELSPVDGTKTGYEVRSREGLVWLAPAGGEHGQIEVLPSLDSLDRTTFVFDRVDA
ncbi:I66 family serine proteinase inhibitor [Kitasatospora sp. NPDC056327]|uniref:I66 family serine proteinase inhibitor n=1 Tax=Kitasatospora sp. NPDC056327 TaxID=3345785 RepID=UPI0035D84ED0